MKKLFFIPVLLCMSFLCKAQYTKMYVCNYSNNTIDFRMTMGNGGCAGAATESTYQTMLPNTVNYYDYTNYPNNPNQTPVTSTYEFILVKVATCLSAGDPAADVCGFSGLSNTYSDCVGNTYTITWYGSGSVAKVVIQ